ncbi:hypothetical protein Mal35_31700 [Gimesia maris]|uniref:hypothetical protein n=1 Tax=Gimesia maris TaxID=122 RepID=UPI00118B2EC6|nr:hypothetical protein [Gimesia maris]QDT79703.1 hypothetical protein Mal35_31700 [Gimesia maris]
MEFNVYYRTYNSYGGHRTLSLIGDFLITGAPSCGQALKELEVIIHIRNDGPPRKSLEEMFERFHTTLAELPRVTFYRKKHRVEITFYGEQFDLSQIESRTLDLDLFCAASREIVNKMSLLQKRIRKTDDFDVQSFQLWLNSRLKELPETHEKLLQHENSILEQRKICYASMSEWHKLGIDFEDFHPKARSILDSPELWNVSDEFSPNGNDTGADVLELYRSWRKQNRNALPALFFNQLMDQWEVTVPPTADDEYSKHTYSQSIIGLAFAQLKLESACHPDIAALALQSLQSESAHDLSDKMTTILKPYV